MVVEELLETLVGVVDANLLEGVDLEDLETRDIQDTNEVSLSLLGKHQVDLLDEPQEKTSIEGLSKGIARESSFLRVELGGDEVATSKNAGLNETLLEVASINVEQVGDGVEGGLVGDLGSLTVGGVEDQVTKVEDGGESSEDGELLLGGDAHDGHGIAGVLELVGIVDSLDVVALALVEELVVLRLSESELLLLVGSASSQDLVEDVVVSLVVCLEDDTRLLQ